ncbi:MAG TPA: hypothetical protein VLV81_08320 [Acidimicrobiia bacterium]|nr:hypothetical protein [Acidimicrobiia bacterium]
MADWLVPLSSHTRFLDRGSHALTLRFDVVRGAALDGRIASVAAEVRGPLADVKTGDTVWLFWAEHDIGVMAVGRARAPRTRRNRAPELPIALEQARTRALVVDPMPSGVIQRWLPDLRSSGIRLDVRPRALEAIRAWERERHDRDEALLRPLGAPTWRARAGRGGAARPVDDPVLSSVVPFLRSQDFSVGLTVRDHAARVVARRARDVLVVHAIGVPGERTRPDAFAAFGRLRGHRWALALGHDDLHLRVFAWLACASRPTSETLAFLDAEGVLVTWLHGAGKVEMSEQSKQRWYQQLGVR